MSEHRFQVNGFDEETFTEHSIFHTQQVNSKVPSYLPGKVHSNVLDDNSGYL